MPTDKLQAVDSYTIDGDVFQVLANEEGQFSIWPASKKVPAGWKEQGFVGTKQEVGDFIEKHWADMRPLSLVRTSSNA